MDEQMSIHSKMDGNSLLEAIISRSNSMVSSRYPDALDIEESVIEYEAIDRNKLLGVESTTGSVHFKDENSQYYQSEHTEYDDEEIHVISPEPDDFYDDDKESKALSQLKNGTNTRKYQNNLSKPIITAGSVQIGLGKARLYGLTDENGNIKPNIIGSLINDPKSIILANKDSINKVNVMSKPKDINIDDITKDDEKYSFHPSKTQDAIKAMKNPRCGYDFITRLNQETNSNVLERLTQTTKKKGLSKTALDALEVDYNAKQDKLQCPNCKKTQSFSEMIDKRRFCSQCNQRFIKLNVTTGETFIKQLIKHEIKRQNNISMIENEMYGKNMKNKYESNKISPIRTTSSQSKNRNRDPSHKISADPSISKDNDRSYSKPISSKKIIKSNQINDSTYQDPSIILTSTGQTRINESKNVFQSIIKKNHSDQQNLLKTITIANDKYSSQSKSVPNTIKQKFQKLL